jgi:outer membrane lipoprotein-sorting protein
VLLALTATLFLVVASACGGDDDDDDGGDNEATATESTDGGDDGGEETPAEETPADDGDDSGDEDVFSQLDELTNELDAVTGKISYDITDSDGSVSSMTFYAKPPNSRFDSSDGTTTTIIIYTPDTTYICDSDTESCLATPGSGDTGALGLVGAFLSPDIISAYVAVAEAAGVDASKSDETINGIDATCFSWDDDSADGVSTGKFCFNDAGVMVYQETEDDSGTSILEATDYSSDVSDSDFEPPYPVTDLGQ